MARPKGPEQRVPVKMRVNIGLMDRLRQLAAENRYSVPKMLTVIMEETLADLPADYELHEMAEIYTLTKNHAVNLSSNRMNVYLLPGTQEAMLELARRLNASIGAVRTSFLLDYLDLRGLLTALRLMERGLSPEAALEMGIINKAFDPFERQLTADVVWARVPRTAKADEFFGD